MTQFFFYSLGGHIGRARVPLFYWFYCTLVLYMLLQMLVLSPGGISAQTFICLTKLYIPLSVVPNFYSIVIMCATCSGDFLRIFCVPHSQILGHFVIMYHFHSPVNIFWIWHVQGVLGQCSSIALVYIISQVICSLFQRIWCGIALSTTKTNWSYGFVPFVDGQTKCSVRGLTRCRTTCHFWPVNRKYS